MTYPLETIVAWAKRKGFVYPNSEIYGGLANAWDYGPYGSLLKKNIADLWINYFVTQRDDMVFMDTAIIANPQTWVASGHAGAFGDALIDDKNTKQRFRADKLLEEWINTASEKVLHPVVVCDAAHCLLIEGGEKGIYTINESLAQTLVDCSQNMKVIIATNATQDKLSVMNNTLADYPFEIFTLEDSPNKRDSLYYKTLCKHLGVSSRQLLFIDRKQENIEAASSVGVSQIYLYNDTDAAITWLSQKQEEYSSLEKYLSMRYSIDNLIPESWGNEKMAEIIKKEIPNNPDTGKPADWTDARQFNLMLQTQLGVIEDATAKAYLRPETCQSLFTNFKNLCNTTRVRIPFGMAQIGKAFRNEITPGQFLFRTREFEQMEIEYFVENNLEKSMEYFAMWKELSMKFRQEVVQLRSENLRFREHEKDELSFYSAGTFDVEYNYPRGWGELQGIANRTDYDLTQHQTVSKQDLQYNDPKTGARYIPYVIEPSFGLSRTVMAVMMDCYIEEELKKENSDGTVNTDTRTVIRFPFALAPVKYAVLPLIEKDEGMVDLGKKVYQKLKQKFNCEFDLGGAIGKRYRRQDEIGTPYCICVDHQSLEDDTVTIRDRDTMEQVRVKWEEIGEDK